MSTDHVTPETGRALRDAGLVWKPAVGDWVWHDGESTLVCDHWDDGVEFCEERSADMADCLWLPTAGQLMRELANRGDETFWWGPDEEAMALALLAALKEEGK